MSGIDAVRFSKTVEIFRGSGCSKIFIDLRSVTDMDSSAIGGLIYLNTVMKNSGVELLLVSPRDQLCELFREFSLEEVFTVLDTSEFHEQSETQSSN
jgi:anti-anti-sigma factor